MHVWIVDYVTGSDGLAMQPGSFGDVYFNMIDVNVTRGYMILSPKTPNNRPSNIWFGSPANYNTSYVDADVWLQLIGSVAYKLQPDIYDCSDYVGTSKLFAMQVVDRFGTYSNTVYVTMVISTAGFIITDGNFPIITTNDLTAEVIANNQNVNDGKSLPSLLSFNQTLSGNYIQALLDVAEDDAVDFANSVTTQSVDDNQ